MTYLVLARKWRPRSFDTLVGQDHVVRALTHALDTQRLHHAWLFTGTRGVGKTTLSRILAKSLNCEQGVTSRPCGQCRACVEIDAGRFVDYVELDAASNRGVDEMTQLLEQAVYAPSSARFKVYMIDEVHMLTGHAFNAMLKTLEEPPPHVKFILATTDPQKIPVTVLSRCLQFNLKHMTVDAIVDHLQGVLREETLAYETPALRLLAQAAGGSMRDALSLTDQAIAYSAGNLTLDAVQGMLGTIDQRHLVRLLQALGAGQASQVLAVADELAARGLSYAGALADLAVLLSHIAIQQRVPGALPADDPLAADVAALANTLHPDLVQLFYSIALHSRSELTLAPDEYAGFVMACLRMLALTPASARSPEPPPSGGPGTGQQSPHNGDAGVAQAADAVQAVPAPVSAPESAPDLQAASEDIPAWEDLPSASEPSSALAPVPTHPPVPDSTENAISDPAAAPTPAVVAERVPEPEDAAVSIEPAPQLNDAAASPETLPQLEPTADSAEPLTAAEWPDVPPGHDDIPLEYLDAFVPDDVGDNDDWLPAGEDVELPAAAKLPSLPQESASAASARAPRLARMTPADWPVLAATLPLTGLAAELARQSEWVGVEGDCITLRVAIRSLAARQGQARLCTVLTEHFGKVVKLAIEFGRTGSGTARAVELERRAQRQKEAEEAVANDTFVRSLIEDFGARIMPGSIRAIDEKVA